MGGIGYVDCLEQLATVTDLQLYVKHPVPANAQDMAQILCNNSLTAMLFQYGSQHQLCPLGQTCCEMHRICK